MAARRIAHLRPGLRRQRHVRADRLGQRKTHLQRALGVDQHGNVRIDVTRHFARGKLRVSGQFFLPEFFRTRQRKTAYQHPFGIPRATRLRRCRFINTRAAIVAQFGADEHLIRRPLSPFFQHRMAQHAGVGLYGGLVVFQHAVFHPLLAADPQRAAACGGGQRVAQRRFARAGDIIADNRRFTGDGDSLRLRQYGHAHSQQQGRKVGAQNGRSHEPLLPNADSEHCSQPPAAPKRTTPPKNAGNSAPVRAMRGTGGEKAARFTLVRALFVGVP